jgi:hypothetical protein
MRLLVTAMLLVAAALFSQTAASAQSAKQYPWCAIYYRMGSSGTPSCYFDAREQCMETISGLGGHCIENQYYRQVAALPSRRAHVAKAHKRASIRP